MRPTVVKRPTVVMRAPVGPVVDIGLLGDRQPGAVRLDQAEPDELAVLDTSRARCSVAQAGGTSGRALRDGGRGGD